jgi:hypothetical protein
MAKVNGNLTLNTGGQSEIQNFIIERLAAEPAVTTAEKGRIYFNTVSNTYFFNNGTIWSAFATGGNAATLQTEVDNLEVSIGNFVATNGTFVGSAFTTANSTVWTTTPASLSDALYTLATYMSGHDTLAELTDVTLGVLTTGQDLMWNGTKWVNHTLVLADISNVTATVSEVNSALSGITSTAAELNHLHGITSTFTELNVLSGIPTTLTSTELGYVDGVTSPIQTQLNNKQPLDAGLTALAALNVTGILVETAPDTYVGRTTVAPAAGITITNANGVVGDITFSLADDLAGLEGLAGTGFPVRTGTSTWIERAITGTASHIVVTNGDGVLASPTIDLATVTNSGTGTFLKLATDGFGRVTGTTPVLLSDIETLANTVYIQAIGDTMTGNLIFTGGATVTGIPSPTADTEAANKAYVDAAVTGLTWKNATVAATVANINLATTGLTAIDGVTLLAGDRVLVKNQTVAAENGIYVAGTGAWTRALDLDVAAEFTNATTFVNHGTTQANSGWTQTATVTTLGTSAVTWIQFNGAAGVIAGIGLSSAGNTLDINMGAGIVALPSDEVGVDLYAVGTSALILTQDGATSDTTTNAKLALKLATSGGLVQDATGLYVTANGITNAMILNETFLLDADDASTGSVALGSTLAIFGTAAQGISSALAGGTITLTIADASYTQKGVSLFDTLDFAVTAGAVSIKAGGVDNAQLAFSTITVTGTTGSDPVALGESFAIVGGSSSITTVSALNSVTISVADAAAAVKGLASFDTNFFTVTAGNVALTATLDDLTNVSSSDAAATNDLLTKSAGDWVPVTRAAMLGTESIDALLDVVITTPAAGQVLSTNGTNWINKKIFHTESMASGTSWTVTHGLGVQFVNVTIYDATGDVVIPQSITATSTTVTTVTFNTAISGTAVIMGVA